MSDRIALISDLIRQHRRADRDALLCAIISRWPDVTGAELQDAIDLSRHRPVLVLARPEAVEQEADRRRA